MTYSITTGGRRAGKSVMIAGCMGGISTIAKAISLANEAEKTMAKVMICGKETQITLDSTSEDIQKIADQIMKEQTLEFKIQNNELCDLPKFTIEPDEPRLPGSFKHRSNKR